MSHRKAIISPYTFSYLEGFNHGCKQGLIENFKSENINRELPDIDVEAAFYACMIQTGVEKFVSLDFSFSSPLSTFLERRSEPLQVAEWWKVFKSVERSIAKFLPENYLEDKRYTKITGLLFFLSDLMLAVERKCSVVVPDSIMDTSKLVGLVPPELQLALNNFMACIESEDTKLPIPKDFVAHEQFHRLQDIICSDLFKEYSARHNLFEDGRILKIDASQNVEELGRTLVAHNKGLLKARRVAVDLIPLSTKIIDTVFGKLPGVVAEFFGQQLSTWLKDDRRIVIYRAGPFTDAISSVYFDSVVKDS